MPDKQQLKTILDAALAAVAPDRAVRNALRLDGSLLHCDDTTYDLDDFKRIIILGAGKGAAPMAGELESLLGDRITDGLICVKYGHALPLTKVRTVEAAHPVPDAAGEKAAHALLDMASKATADDLILCVITGGTSALTPAPADGISLEDVQQTTRLLMNTKTSIHEMNTVRKHLSLFSGGQFACAAQPATMLTLIVSDVVGDDLGSIASGPTSPDQTTFAEAHAVIERTGLLHFIPEEVRQRLESGMAGDITETPKPGDDAFAHVQNVIVASNHMALDAAMRKAEEMGYDARIISEEIVGEARVEATSLATLAGTVANAPHNKHVCLITGGETVVKVLGEGEGGRNQEMALAFAMAARGDKRIHALFAGTDGTDGPTDAAGGYALPGTLARAKKAGLDPQAYLDNNDAYRFLRGTGDLLITGPTRTNVMDISIILVD